MRVCVEFRGMIRLLRSAPANPKNLTWLFVLLGVFAAACFGVVPLLGLPGAALLGLAMLVLHPLLTPATWAHMTADVYWLLSLMMSVLWPLGILPGYFLAFTRSVRQSRRVRVLVFFAIVAAWDLGVSAALLLSQ